jgi:uncharacterized protein involved in response to NO
MMNSWNSNSAGSLITAIVERRMARSAQRRWISGADLASEPFRLFFPAGVVAGLVGVSLWPLHLLGLKQFYPGASHARIMVFGFFAAFIFGFLGTAMPRMLSTRPFRRFEILPLFIAHITMVVAFAFDRLLLGDLLFLVLLTGFIACLVPRLKQRQDTPPPGFVLVGFAFLSVASGALVGVILHYVEEPSSLWITLQKLLAYQGFVLMPILGIGPFILPRLFGMESSHNFPESLAFPPGWGRKAALAAITGFLIFASFLIEAGGWIRTGNSLRFLTVLAYLSLELPLRSTAPTNALGLCIRLAFAGVLAGFLAVAIWPGYRVALLHFTLVGGFAIVTVVVATRVVFGHSGQLAKLKGRNTWLLASVILMLIGMATRISADFLPKVLVSHYIYGALFWSAGLLLWAAFVLPRVLLSEPET